ncbi:MAG TPA: hypothetical protein PKY59_16560 [Pyrinomonadaceae bacterium]|nr:hypothetical protein [Pyrinomonadaceae bacterium]
MADDLEYFTEFLNDPAAVSIAKFYDMANAWGTYLVEHKELNYLTDDRWKEIRERLIEEFQKREAIRLDIEDEWEYLTDMSDNDQMSDEEALERSRERLEFMRMHQEYFGFTDEVLAGAEEHHKQFAESYEAHLIAQKNLRRSEFEVENSLADLDDKLAEISEKRGRPFHIHSLKDVKKHNGN